MIDKEFDMKKTYNNPQLTFAEFNTNDVITTSLTDKINFVEEGDGFGDGEAW